MKMFLTFAFALLALCGCGDKVVETFTTLFCHRALTLGLSGTMVIITICTQQARTCVCGRQRILRT